MSSTEIGTVLVYVLLYAALLVLGMVLAGVYLGEPLNREAVVLGVVSALVAAAAVVYEGWRNLEGLLKAGVVTSIGVVIFAVVYMVTVREVGSAALTIAASGAGVALLLGAEILRRRRQPESPWFPELLRYSFAEEEIAERDGVQAVAVVTPGRDTGPHEVHVYLQNCVAAPRRVRLRVEVVRGLLQAPRRVDLELAPAVVGHLVVPVWTGSRPGKYELALDWTAQGPPGRRLRPWRAPTLEHRLSGWRSLLLLPFGVLHWGGGYKVRLPPHPAGFGDSLPDPWVEVLWQPELGTLEMEGLA